MLFHKHNNLLLLGSFPCCSAGFIKYLRSNNSFAKLCVSKVLEKFLEIEAYFGQPSHKRYTAEVRSKYRE